MVVKNIQTFQVITKYSPCFSHITKIIQKEQIGMSNLFATKEEHHREPI